MSNVIGAYETLNPNFFEPGIILPYAQASGAFECVYEGGPHPRLSEGDLQVYMKGLNLRTQIAAGSSSSNALPSVDVVGYQISTSTYLMQVNCQYNHHDLNAFSRQGISLVEAQRLGMQQAHVQQARNALLYGFNPAVGEGLLNTPGAYSTTLPPDSNGNDTVSTYDNGQLAFFLLGQIQAIKRRTNTLGIPGEFVILGPQEIFGPMEYQNIVQLTQYQRVGAGSTTTAGVIKDVLTLNGDRIIWAYDDTLVGKGPNGTDVVLVVMPEVKKPDGGKLNTNIFATLAPGIQAGTMMYSDMAAPREIISPLPHGTTEVLSEWRITSGWGIRPEVLSITYMAP